VADGSISTEVKEWFLSLEPEQRQECLSYEHEWLCSVLQRMLHRKVKEGEGSFSLQEERLVPGDTHHDYFYFQRKEYDVFPGTKQTIETELEGLIRLTDGEEPLDTLTVSPAAAKDPQRLLRLMGELTQNQALEVPCRLTWEPFFKMWTLESPVWFCAKTFNSIASWICCALEKAIWSRYWEKIRVGEELKYLGDSVSLNEFWSGLSRSRRADLLGEYRALCIEFREFKLEDFINERSAVCMSDFVYPSYSPTYLLPQKFADLKRTISQFNSEDSLRDLIQIAYERSPEEFFEFLLLSPLDRAGTRLDLLCRKVAMKIKDALSQKTAEDLLSLEGSEKRGRRKKKKQSKRRHSEDSSSTSASERINLAAVDEELDEDFGRRIVAALLLSIIQDTQVTKDTHEDVRDPSTSQAPLPEDDNFLTVTHTRRKLKTSPKVHRRKDNAKHRHKKPHHHPRQVSPVAKLNPVAFVQWESPESSVKALSIGEFPPLSPAVQAKPNYDRLTKELERMKEKCEDALKDLRPARLRLMDKIDDIVGSLFPGSFIQLYGSYATGLALPWSDIDIVVVNSGAYNSELLITSLKVLGSALSSCKWVRRVVVLDKAAVPVIKLTAHGCYFGSEQAIEADISIDEFSLDKQSEVGNSGMATTLVTQQILYDQPQVAGLCFFLKQLLHKHKLNSSFKGGVNSYTITLWVAAYSLALNDSSGPLLIGFLDFFGSKFDPATQAVSYNEGGFVRRPPTSCGVVETRDPINLANNTSRSSFNFESVQTLLRKAHDRLKLWATSPRRVAFESVVGSL
jgi:DNA polymerase sigma